MKNRARLVLLRHGQSEWNKKNRFTGWVDIPLSREGIVEAQTAGRCMSLIPFDIIFISSLMRAQQTAMIAMTEHESGKTPCLYHKGGKLEEWAQIHDPQASAMCIPVYAAWELNERMYGELQGLNKDKARSDFGKDQVEIWRRSFNTPPPGGESLKMTAERSIPYFKQEIVPILKQGKHVLVSAHGNSLRSIVMYLDELSEEEVVKLEVPTGKPLCYSYHNACWTKESIENVQREFENLS